MVVSLAKRDELNHSRFSKSQPQCQNIAAAVVIELDEQFTCEKHLISKMGAISDHVCGVCSFAHSGHQPHTFARFWQPVFQGKRCLRAITLEWHALRF
jgi:hypothetical protein